MAALIHAARSTNSCVRLGLRRPVGAKRSMCRRLKAACSCAPPWHGSAQERPSPRHSPECIWWKPPSKSTARFPRGARNGDWSPRSSPLWRRYRALERLSVRPRGGEDPVQHALTFRSGAGLPLARKKRAALLRLPRLVAAFVLHRLRGRAVLMPATEIGTVRTEAATTAMTPSPAMSEAILTAVALVIAIRADILLRLSAAGNECGQIADLLSALAWRLVWLRLMLRAVVHLLVAWRKRLRIAGQIGLLLRFTRRVAWFVLAHERLGVVIVTLKVLVAALLLPDRRALLWLL